MSDDDIKNKIKDLSDKLSKSKKEIEYIEKSIRELSEKMQKNQQMEENQDLRKMVNDVTDLFNSTFNVMGISGKTDNDTKKKGGFIDIINKLTEISEKTEKFKKEFDISGKKGVVEYKISARPLKGRATTQSNFSRTHPRNEPSLDSILEALPRSLDEKEPTIEITENGDTLTILIELPSLDEKKIMVDVDQDKLKISTGKEGKDVIEVDLPKKVEKVGIKHRYVNGILEVILKKVKNEVN